MSDITYPKDIKVSVWEDFLGRELKYDEKLLLHDLQIEIMMNKKMDQLHEKLKKKNLRVAYLTNLDGNCLFESLVYYGIGEDSDSLRQAVAYIMYQFQDYKYLIPGNDLSLKEIFNLTNEIEYVYNNKDKKLYKYTYEIMCMDLACGHSWSISPTHSILLTLSRILYLQFWIMKNTGTNQNDNEFRLIDAFEATDIKPSMRSILLGHILESHFIPIQQIDNEEDILNYSKIKHKFHQWALEMERQKIQKINLENKINVISKITNKFEGFTDFENI